MSVSDVFEQALDSYKHSHSYRLFQHTFDQLKKLLEFAAAGLLQKTGQPAKLIAVLDDAVAGRPREANPGENLIEISLEENQIEILKEVLAEAAGHEQRLTFYLHSVLLIALWSSFEAYLQSIIAEFFRHNPAELASDKQITVKDLLNRPGEINDYLIEREISDFGHSSLEGMMKYVKSRLHFEFDANERSLLKDLYFLRNVAAHNSGYIRASQQQLLPVDINVYNNQIEISAKYLESAFAGLHAAVTRADSYLIGRWNIAQSHGALFEKAASVEK
jgi:hypothetical protein